MADLKATFKLTGAKEFERMLIELGKVPAAVSGLPRYVQVRRCSLIR